MNSPSFLSRQILPRLLPILGVAATLAVSGCGRGEPFIGHVDATFTDDGNLHVLSRFRSGWGESNDWESYEYLVASQSGDSTTVRSCDMGPPEVSFDREPPYRLQLDAAGRAILVGESNDQLDVRMLSGQECEVVPAASGLGEDALLNMQTGQQLGAVWSIPDHSIKVMYGRFIYTIADGVIASAVDIEVPCSYSDHCYFDPTGDMSGDAAIRKYKVGFVQKSLTCAPGASHCEWGAEEILLGDDDLGGSSDPLHRVFFHTEDGAGVLVRKVDQGGTYAEDSIVASTAAGETVLFSGEVFQLGGGPVPGGGYAAASLGRDKVLHLAIVSPSGDIQKIELGDVDFGEEPVQVLGRGDKLHVIVRESKSAAAHFTVSLPSGAFTRESIALR